MASGNMFGPRQHAQPPPAEVEEAEAAEDDGVSPARVGAKPCASVRFCKRDGTGWSFTYGHLYGVRFDGQGELVVLFTGHTVRITGWNLGRLLTYLEDHKAKVVRESESAEARFRQGEMGIASIQFDEVKG